MCVCVCICVREKKGKRERERKNNRENHVIYVYYFESYIVNMERESACVWERESVYVCVRERAIERDREPARESESQTHNSLLYVFLSLSFCLYPSLTLPVLEGGGYNVQRPQHFFNNLKSTRGIFLIFPDF